MQHGKNVLVNLKSNLICKIRSWNEIRIRETL
jgi:hypothetical protein